MTLSAGVETYRGIDDEVSAAEAGHLLGIDPQVIRVWANRGDIEKRTAADGSPVYLLREVVDREAKKRRKPLLKRERE
jgi:hypothetical protein